MEDYSQHNMAILSKRDQKELLLTNKDPHLSHLFDHSEPHTSCNVSAEGLTHSSIEVERSYSEGNTEPEDYQLFEEQGGSYMPVSVENSSCNDVQTSLEESTYHHSVGLAPDNGSFAENMNLMKSVKVIPHHTATPPDHYNMQLLAHSAQQQQQLLHEEQLRKQQSIVYGQGSSSAALQHFAKLRQQQDLEAASKEDSKIKVRSPSPYNQMMTENTKTNNSLKPIQTSFLVPEQQNALSLSLTSKLLSQPIRKSQYPNISTASTRWDGSDRGTPDLSHGQFRELSFNSQDSPILPLQSTDLSRHPSKTFLSTTEQKHLISSHLKSVSTCPEPELKSPLDHPEHQLDQQQCRHFFSSDSGPVSGGEDPDDEAPLNDRDKQAAAALRVLLEQSEKVSQLSIDGLASRPPSIVSYQSQASIPSVSSTAGTSMPFRYLQLQQEIPTAPPPTYQQFPETQHSFQQLPLPSGAYSPRISASSALNATFNNMQSSHIVQNNNVVNGHIKKEPLSPAVTGGQRFLLTSALNHQRLEAQVMSKVTGNKSYSTLHSVQGMGLHMSDSSSTYMEGNKVVNSSMSLEDDARGSMHGSVDINRNIGKVSSSSVKVALKRVRRTSSTDSASSHKKSETNLTCTLCGHTFRSTPALNGHMRVHSNSDKKNKGERQSRSAHSSSDYSVQAVVSSPLARINVTPAPFVSLRQSSAEYPVPNVASNSTDVGHVGQPYITDSTIHQSQARSHNGLLTMASAACYLKTEPIGPEYLHQSPVLPQAYVMSHPMLFQQPPLVNVFGAAIPEGQPDTKSNLLQTADGQTAGYSQLYHATQFQQGVPINFLPNMQQTTPPLLSQDASYPRNEQPHVVQESVLIPSESEAISTNPQSYVNSQMSINKQNNIVTPEEAYQYNPQQLVETNSLSQLALIAVAAANRDNMPELAVQQTSEFAPPRFIPNEMNSISASSDPNGAPEESWMRPTHEVVQQGCINQQPMYSNSNMGPERSPITSGHDPFILPANVSALDRLEVYGLHDPIDNISSSREQTVTWQDRHDIQSNALVSYDDPLMQEAVNVANPSKILPNSMMGGTPPVGSVFHSGRPFRQRHYSEGAHLFKSPEISMFNSASPVELQNQITSPDIQDNFSFVKPENLSTNERLKVHQPGTGGKSAQPIKVNTKKEVWAEPRPIQRKLRRRRHSADCRLISKLGPTSGLHTVRQSHMTGSSMKKPNTLHSEARVRRRPPPLVIPSSVNTFALHGPGHANFYQSHLHHRRRPSGESASSLTGMNDKIPPYTPPPMLSPIRAGSGLYCMTPVTSMTMFNRQKSMEASSSIPTIVEEDETEDEELIRSTEPKINIGSRFQAVIPKMCEKKTIASCKHKASKVWGLSPPNANNDEVFKHTERFLELSCSAVVPFGGANKEYAIDCLAKKNGDILAAVRRVVMRKTEPSHPQSVSCKYIGSGRPWTMEEGKLFDRAMLEHRKDFFIISKMVKTRSTYECVERYYHVVKRHRRRIRIPRRYREQENENDFMSLLSDSPSAVDERKMKSITSRSSSDEEIKASTQSMQDSMILLCERDAVNPAYTVTSQSNQHAIHNRGFKKTHAARLHQGRIDAISPAASPGSVASADEQPTQLFTCPVCGKSFGKVKSRNAHMKTHGKQAQEKRRQREEEAARQREEMARRVAPVGRIEQMRPSFVPATNASQLYQTSLHLPRNIMPRFGSNV